MNGIILSLISGHSKKSGTSKKRTKSFHRYFGRNLVENSNQWTDKYCNSNQILYSTSQYIPDNFDSFQFFFHLLLLILKLSTFFFNFLVFVYCMLFQRRNTKTETFLRKFQTSILTSFHLVVSFVFLTRIYFFCRCSGFN